MTAKRTETALQKECSLHGSVLIHVFQPSSWEKKKNKQLAFFTKRFNKIRRSGGEIEVNTEEKRGGRSR